MEERRGVSNRCRRVAQQLEGNGRVLDVVPLDDVPQCETEDSNDERCEDVGGGPRVLLSTGKEGDDEEGEGGDEDEVTIPDTTGSVACSRIEVQYCTHQSMRASLERRVPTGVGRSMYAATIPKMMAERGKFM